MLGEDAFNTNVEETYLITIPDQYILYSNPFVATDLSQTTTPPTPEAQPGARGKYLSLLYGLLIIIGKLF